MKKWLRTLREWLTDPYLILYHPDGHPPTPPWWVPIWNWTRWRVYLRSFRAPEEAPKRFRVAYLDYRYDMIVMAIPPIHWLLRAWNWWSRYRWRGEILMVRLGALHGEENTALSTYRWRWPWVSKWTLQITAITARQSGFRDGLEVGQARGMKAGRESVFEDIVKESRNLCSSD